MFHVVVILCSLLDLKPMIGSRFCPTAVGGSKERFPKHFFDLTWRKIERMKAERGNIPEIIVRLLYNSGSFFSSCVVELVR